MSFIWSPKADSDAAGLYTNAQNPLKIVSFRLAWIPESTLAPRSNELH